MKELKSILKESIFDDNIDVYNGIKDEITRFIEDNYIYNGKITISNKPNKNGLYEVSSNGSLCVANYDITSLTNNIFEWSEIKGDFYCNNCKNLKSLKGAPKNVNNTFNCANCKNLKSLEGGPKSAGRSFYCHKCDSLISLKGAPKKVGKDFDCNSCKNLKLLEGAPKEVGGDFSCEYCNNLKSLKGAPKKVGGIFNCSNCGVKFTKDDIKKVSDVKGNIYC